MKAANASSSRPSLNENHVRRVLSTFSSADDLLASVQALTHADLRGHLGGLRLRGERQRFVLRSTEQWQVEGGLQRLVRPTAFAGGSDRALYVVENAS